MPLKNKLRVKYRKLVFSYIVVFLNPSHYIQQFPQPQKIPLTSQAMIIKKEPKLTMFHLPIPGRGTVQRSRTMHVIRPIRLLQLIIVGREPPRPLGERLARAGARGVVRVGGVIGRQAHHPGDADQLGLVGLAGVVERGADANHVLLGGVVLFAVDRCFGLGLFFVVLLDAVGGVEDRTWGKISDNYYRE